MSVGIRHLTLRLDSLTKRPGRLSGFAAVLQSVAQGGWGDTGGEGALAQGGGVRGAGHYIRTIVQNPPFASVVR